MRWRKKEGRKSVCKRDNVRRGEKEEKDEIEERKLEFVRRGA